MAQYAPHHPYLQLLWDEDPVLFQHLVSKVTQDLREYYDFRLPSGATLCGMKPSNNATADKA
jgi:hypothetical protein